jgi:GT2 family glycosyltransferase
VVGNFSKIQSARNISLSTEIPTVSIILLNHEKPHLSLLAFVAAASSGITVPFEILAADNGSSQESISQLREGKVPIRILELGRNLGFGLANNRAVQEARGEYLLLVNNDAFLDEGSVNEMMWAFREMPDCRIVGCVLRYPDGTVQEAGATLKPDGHPIRHGRNDTKFKTRSLPRFNHVDYVSGACLMIGKSDFLEMGGFDEKYAPAYYEDTDLCMRALLYGQKVYLASRAICYHIENATSSTKKDSTWSTRTAEAHRLTFLKDWGAYLESRDPQDLPHHLKR